ncbi:type VI secretion system tip protein VgrG [Burkholderia pyrrocinia]|uniref:type VI secretion system Vgr family protein n=1 Tax=Burkholderia pyrrocinia TaxID=60550 RepID=UPI001FB4065B|nr:type VI secretion system Vgr family protein [Burkholderia pyrrocinia]UOB54736.1 type VI secretion system tip protein VgrG [Burkholderia pyrrocinia]
MSLSETISSFAAGAVDWNRRPVALNFGRLQSTLGHLLALQHANVREGLMAGIHGHLTCVSARHDLSPKLFIGVPISVRLVTDRGQLHLINAIVQDVQIGQSDGELCVYQLTVCDALSLMDKRTNSRVFRKLSVVDILGTLFNEWRQRSPALARAFEFDLSGLRRDRYPARELTRQVNESDAKFVRRLLRREGITIFAKAGAAQGERTAHDDTPIHTLVCCDDPGALPEAPAGTVRLHPRDAGTEERDTVTLFALHARLVPGMTSRPSWDYKKARIDESTAAGSVDQGEAGNDLAKLLTDVAIDVPHAGDSWDDHERLTRARMLAHQFEAEQYDGASGVRDLAVGTWITLAGDPEWDMQSTDKRQFVVTSIDHEVWNNLPKGLTERVQALFAASHNLAFQSRPRPSASAEEADTRYENTFTCVRRGVPLTPAYDPKIDLPPVHLLTGVIVTRDGEEVVCDELGRVYVRIQGLDPADHTHAQGAGTNDNVGDSAPIRVASSLAGTQFGASFLPRAGMEVLLGSIGGDPDRLVIISVLGNGVNQPATFTHTGSLPGNRYVSGIKTKEIKGKRYNQLRLDDTPGQISSQLASEHAHSQLNLGYLTQPRDNGAGQDRGEGAELRTDAAAALRAAQGILLTTYARSQASGGQLDRDELLQLLGECTELFKSLGDYAGQHGGQAADTAGQVAVSQAFKNWAPRSGTSESGSGPATTSQALMALGAQAGSVNVTPKTHVTYAGENIDQVAQQHLQLMSGQRFNATAGQGMQLFARGTGMQAVAGEGPMLLQAQADSLTANAQKGVKIATNENEVLVTAPTIRLVAEDGSYIKIGDGVTLGTSGDIKLLSASHQWGGPSTQQASKAAFANQPTDQRFRLHFPGQDGDTPVAANRAYRMTLDDGRVVEGKSGPDGLTDLVSDDAMRIVKIDILKNPLA